MSMTNVAGASLISGGAALVGAMSGWELGPYRLDLTRDQFAIVGGTICGILAIAACSLAVERSEARARSRAAVRRLTGFLFQSSNTHNSDQPSGLGSPVREEALVKVTANGARS